MDPITIVSFGAMIALGVGASYSDLRYGKIRNSHIVASILIGVGLLLIQFSWLKVIDALSAAFIGFLLWYVGLWSAGDGKLFTAFSLLMPMQIYANVSGYFPSTSILVNTFVPAAVVLGFLVFRRAHKSDVIQVVRKVFTVSSVGQLFVSVFAFMWMADGVRKILPFSGGVFYTVIVLFLIVSAVEFVTRLKLTGIVVIVGAIRVLYDNSIWSFQFLGELAGFVLIFAVVRMFLLDLSFRQFSHEVYIDKLVPGMIPAEVIFEQGETVERKPHQQFSFFSYLHETKGMAGPPQVQLTAAMIEQIKGLREKHSDVKTFKIQESIAFAHFLFLGVILTIILGAW